MIAPSGRLGEGADGRGSPPASTVVQNAPGREGPGRFPGAKADAGGGAAGRTMRERTRGFDSGWVGASPDDDLDRRLATEEEPFDLGRPHVMTVLGPIEPGALGVTLVDERVVLQPAAEGTDPDFRLDDADAALAELEDVYAAGARGLVDGATADRGRDAAALRWVAARAPVHLVAVTGRDRRSAEPSDARNAAADHLADAFIGEMTAGIGGSGARPGAIVAGVAGGADAATDAESDAAVLCAAALAHLGSGAPILLRANSAAAGLRALDALGAAGVAPARVVVGGCHAGAEAGDRLRLAQSGVYLAFDRLGEEAGRSARSQATEIGELVAAGFGDRIVLSAGLTRRSSHRAYGGGPGWVGTLERFPLALMEAGLDASAVRRLLVDNPAGALTIGKETG